ncbi:MAG: hypothetical protein O3A14_20865 [Cyanobacteria bacterium]|nr:hypothetical protein [Cyanobacteriota bacterium]
MQSYTNPSQLPLDQQRRHLEALIHPPQSSRQGLGKALTQLGQGIVNWLANDSQPHITQIRRGGTEVWKVHNPMNNQVLYFDHEDQVRVWLENRHNG